MIRESIRRRAVELAEEIARNEGLSSHRDFFRLDKRGTDAAVRARKSFLREAVAQMPNLSSLQLAELMGCHHTTVLHHLGRTGRAKHMLQEHAGQGRPS